MPRLNLRRLLPPRKVWRIITNKLQLRSHKLNKSKLPIKNPKIRSKQKASKKLSWLKSNISIQPKKFKHQKQAKSHASLGYQCHSLCNLRQKLTTPVLVDKLFIQPVSVIQEVDHDKEKCCSSSSSLKKSGISDYNQKSDYFVKDEDEGVHYGADDMWESMVLASPQMNGINERAEEFIARFRAEMQQQENLARRL